MRFGHIALGIIIVVAMVAHGQAAIVEIAPATQTATVGGTASIDIIVDGLAAGGPDSLGAFELNLSYDPAVLTFDAVLFGSLLGDESLGESIRITDDTTPGLLRLAEVSLLTPIELDVLQPASFTLATVAFIGASLGHSVLNLSGVVLSDSLGTSIPVSGTVPANGASVHVTAIPEPTGCAVWLLLMVATIARCTRRPILC